MAEQSVFLTRDDLLKDGGERYFRTREIPVGKRTLLIREPTGDEYLAIVRSEEPAEGAAEQPDSAKLQTSLDRVARLVAKLAVDEKSEAIYSDESDETVAKIRQRFGTSVLMDVYRSIIRTIREDQLATGEQ